MLSGWLLLFTLKLHLKLSTEKIFQDPDSGFHLHWKRGRGGGEGGLDPGGGGGTSSFHFFCSNACLGTDGLCVTPGMRSRSCDLYRGRSLRHCAPLRASPRVALAHEA